MENLSVGQVVLAAFPFSDLKTTKVRPCLVIGLAEFDDVILCQITSQAYGGKTALSLSHSDLDEGSIATDSFIRPDKIVTAARSRVHRILGTITDSKLANVKDKLAEIFEFDKTP